MTSFIHRVLSIFDKSLNLTLFLVSFEYHCKLINAIVHSIASIVITTISSTRVKAFFCLFIKTKYYIFNVFYFTKKKLKLKILFNFSFTYFLYIF